VENGPIHLDLSLRGWVPLPVCSPVDQLSFGDGEDNAHLGAFGISKSIQPLQQLDVAVEGVRRGDYSQVVLRRAGEAIRDFPLEALDIYHELKG